MSGGTRCRCGVGKHIPYDNGQWRVTQRRCNHSKFNGSRRTPSLYSEVECSACGAVWRTNARYVDRLPDQVRSNG